MSRDGIYRDGKDGKGWKGWEKMERMGRDGKNGMLFNYNYVKKYKQLFKDLLYNIYRYINSFWFQDFCTRRGN